MKTLGLYEIPKVPLCHTYKVDLALASLARTDCYPELAIESLSILGISTSHRFLSIISDKLMVSLARVCRNLLRLDLEEKDVRKVINAVCRIGGPEMIDIFLQILERGEGVSVETQRLIIYAPFHSSLKNHGFSELEISQLTMAGLKHRDHYARLKALDNFFPKILLHPDFEALILAKLFRLVDEGSSDTVVEKSIKAVGCIIFHNAALTEKARKYLEAGNFAQAARALNHLDSLLSD